MNDNTKWIIIAFLAACIAASPVACTIHGQMVIAAGVKSGADPIAMRCALSVDSNSAMCLAKSMQPGSDPIALRCATRVSSDPDPVCIARGLQPK